MLSLDALLDCKVSLGQKLSSHQGQQLLYGLYPHQGHVYCSVSGTLKMSSSNRYFVQRKDNHKRIAQPFCTGDILYCEVIRLREEQVFLAPLQLNDHPLPYSRRQSSNNQVLSQLCLRREHLQNPVPVTTAEAVRVGDIVRVRLISSGDSVRNGYVTMAERGLGVVVARSEVTGRVMVPLDWTTVGDPIQGINETRKVAGIE